MLSKKQLNIINSYNNYRDLALDHPKIVYLIRKYQIEPYRSQLQKTKVSKKLWTKEIIIKCAEVCRNRGEFCKYFDSASSIARRDGYFDELMKDKPFWKDNFTKYDLKSVLDLCNQPSIKTYQDFRLEYKSPYQQSYQQGWLEVIKMFFIQKQYQKNVNIESFMDVFSSEVKRIIPKKKNKVFHKHDNKKYSNEYLINIATQYDNAQSFQKEHPYLYTALVQRSLTLKVFKKPLSTRYSDQELYQIALKYSTRTEFKEKSSGAYYAAKTRKLLNKICHHMKRLDQSIGELLVRKAFNYHFNTIFYKIKPEWLKNPKTNKVLELDGYNDELKIAFEVNGYFHYKNDKFKDVKEIQYRDRQKVIQCKNKNIKLYVFKYKTGQTKELCQQLYLKLNIPMNVLLKFKLESLPSLNKDEIKNIKHKYSLNKTIKILSLDKHQQCSIINNLRKEDLSSHKIGQILKISKNQLNHIIKKLRDNGFNIIHR